MARRRKCKQDKLSKAEQAEQAKQALQAHLHALGLTSVAQYKAWCSDYGFGTSTYKNRNRREQERMFVVRQAADARRTAMRRESRHVVRAIDGLFTSSAQSSKLRSRRLTPLVSALKAVEHDRRAKKAFERLVRYLHSCGHMPDDRQMTPQLGSHEDNTFAGGLAMLACHNRAWLRDVESWKPRSHNVRRQFSSLARHLMAEYDVPAFMDAAWFSGRSAVAHQQQQWFIHIGRGRNIRTAELPVPYTKRMAHHFLMAPSDYTVLAALRWGQIHGIGGDARLADAICETRLAESLDQDDFWITVLRFLIANPMLDTVHVGPIVDYLYDQRFQCREVFVARGVLEQQPPAQPNLSMKGRTAESLLRQVERWHCQLAKETGSGLQWEPSGLRGFQFLEGSQRKGNLRRWSIRELLSAGELNQEGRTMRHCVASYAGSCARRATSIWSMTLDSYEGIERVLTIEVRLANRTINQARGRRNIRPNDKARNIMQRWATEQGLTIANHA